MKEEDEVKRLAPKESTIKKLFALSGNICAFPGCTECIVSNEGSIVGDICHIVAAQKDGPRSRKNCNNEYRRSLQNLILLCKKHHKIVDDNEEYYDEKFLKNIKKQHEQKFKDKNLIKKFEEAFYKQEDYNKCILNYLDSIERTTTSTDIRVQEIQKKLESTFDTDFSDFLWYLEKEITEENICCLHRDIMQDCYPDYLRGIYRQEEAWVGHRGCTKDNCDMETIAPDKISEEMKNFIQTWQQLLSQKDNITQENKIRNLAKLHFKFLKIHPFHDGNGRVSRVIFIAQVFLLENRYIKNPFTNKKEYFLSLKEADNNNFYRLERIIENGLAIRE